MELSGSEKKLSKILRVQIETNFWYNLGHEISYVSLSSTYSTCLSDVITTHSDDVEIDPNHKLLSMFNDPIQMALIKI